MLTLATSLGAAILSCVQLNCPSAGAICQQELGPAAANGDNGRLGYDINAGTGNLFLSHADIEARPPLGPILAFARFYNNQGNGTDIGLGANWTHSYSWAVSVSAGVASIVRDTGQVVQFSSSGASWIAQAGEFGTLTGATTTGFTYTATNGTAYAFDNTTSNSGRLLSITPADDTAITVSYSSGVKISSVTSSTLSLTFTYTGTHITQIADPTSQDWSYGYTGSNLTSVTFPNNDGSGHNGQTLYGYSNVTVGTTTFHTGTSAGQITQISALQVSGTWVPIAYFSYTNPVAGSSQVAAAASGYDGTNLLRYVTLSYNLCAGGTFTTTATFPVGTSTTKTITSSATSSLNFPRVTSITSTGGSGAPGENTSESYSWNSNLTLASFTNGNGYVRSISSYDSKGNPTTIVEASGSAVARTTTLTYHSVLSRPLTMTRLSVDGTHNHVVTWDYNSTYTTTYNSSPTNYLHQIVESGYTDSALAGGVGTQLTRTSQIYYDASNRVTEVDNLSAASPDAGYEKTTFAYYAAGSYANYLETANVYTTSSTYLTTTYNTYDGDGRLTSVTDPNSTSTAYTYDPIGKATQVQVTQTPNTLTETYAYDLAEDLVTHTTPEGTTLGMEYDGALRMWRQHAQISSGGTTPWSVVYDFDSWSHPVTVRRFAGLGTDEGSGCTNTGSEQLCKELAYDAYRRLASERTLDSSNNTCTGSNCEVLYTYDADGNLATRSEAGLNVYTFYRDPLDRVNKVLLPTSYYSTVTYDINDGMITRYDPKSSVNGGSGSTRETTYLNDDFGRAIKVVNPDVGTWISNYDTFGNLSASKDALGAQLNYGYDLLNRRTAVDGGVANEAVSYSYDQTGSIGGISYTNTYGRLTSILAKDSSGNLVNTHYTYDLMGRTLADVEERGPSGSATTAAIQYSWNKNGDPATLTYPDGLVATYKYPADGGYAPVPLPNEIDVPFNGTATALISNVNYFSDGVVSNLSYGNGSVRSITRNLRGEWTSLTSGPSGSPVLSQTYTYDAHGLGELTDVSFFHGHANTWDWTFGYDSLRRLTAYTTDVRPTTDNYAWNYDEVGNRTSQVYNTATTTYTYDGSNNTSQLATLTGATSRSWTYDSAGDVAQDHFTGIAGTWNQYAYSTRHHVARFDFYSGSTFQHTTETYQDDGLDRRWSKVNVAGTWTELYYDGNGRILEEYQKNGVTVNGCAAYDVVDHVYLPSGNETARDIRRFESDGGGCTVSFYNFVDQDLRFVHEDYRSTVFAVEARAADGGLVWVGETSPSGITVNEGLPGADGKIGTIDDLPFLVPETFGLTETFRDSEFSNLSDSTRSILLVPATDRNTQPTLRIFDPAGLAAYGPSGWFELARSSTFSLVGPSGSGASGVPFTSSGGSVDAELGLSGTFGASGTARMPARRTSARRNPTRPVDQAALVGKPWMLTEADGLDVASQPDHDRTSSGTEQSIGLSSTPESHPSPHPLWTPGPGPSGTVIASGIRYSGPPDSTSTSTVGLNQGGAGGNLGDNGHPATIGGGCPHGTCYEITWIAGVPFITPYCCS